jgi:hypothetical protein
MCQSHDPAEPSVQLRQCPHGTIYLTVGATTLHLAPRELLAIYHQLRQAIKTTDTLPSPPHPWSRRFGSNLN